MSFGQKHTPPEPPLSFTGLAGDTSTAASQVRRRNGLRGFPWFVTKQLLIFAGVVFVIILVDLLLMAFVSLGEQGFIESTTPKHTVQEVADNITKEEDGSWYLPLGLQSELDRQKAWAILIQNDSVVWDYAVPEDVPRTFTIADMAVDARYGKIGDYPVFFWSKGDDSLVVLGYAPGTYVDFSLHLTSGQGNRMVTYGFGILLLDLAILFLYIVLRRSMTRRSTVPIAEALDDLANGRPVSVSVGGDLREVGRTLNEASAALRAKDEARERWIAGVSHDIRTPLAMIAGYGDSLARSENLSDDQRKEAELIRSQSLRIADLVQDLNTASRLEYDTQPLDVADEPLAPMLRTLIADYLNGRLPEGFELSLIVAENAQHAVFRGDARLLNRAIYNLIQNAIVHNPAGCAITVRLDTEANRAFITVADNGRGLSPEALGALRQKLSSKTASAGSNGHGLGLVLVQRIAQVHGGSLTLRANGGFEAVITLPIILS